MTATPEERRLARALDRMAKAMFAMAAGGMIVLLIWRGWQWSAGWLLGCAASTLNYRWLRRVIFSLGSGGEKDRKGVLLGLRLDEPLAVSGVAVTGVLRNQHLHRLADQFVTAVAEQPLRLRVDQHDQPIRVNSDDRVWRRLQEAARPGHPLRHHDRLPRPYRE